MKITFFEIQGWEKPMIKKALKNHTLKFIKEPLTQENIKLAVDSDIISMFIYTHLDHKILSQLKKLKFIATRSTGFDHIDIKYCKTKKIKVFNVPSYGENTVAEHTFALILALSKPSFMMKLSFIVFVLLLAKKKLPESHISVLLLYWAIIL